MLCDSCGKENIDDAVYCMHCGKKLIKTLNDFYSLSSERYNNGKQGNASVSTKPSFIEDYSALIIIIVLCVLISGIFYSLFSDESITQATTTPQTREVNKPPVTKNTEICDRTAILEECNRRLMENDARRCLTLSDNFLKSCGEYDQVHAYRNTAARNLSNWESALDSANKLVKLYPYNANSYFMRAETYQEKGDITSAIIDYEQTLLFMPDAIQSPFHLANLYQRVGQPCSGITPLEQFSYHHPELSHNAETILKSLYQNPDCKFLRSNGNATIQVSRNGKSLESTVLLNGIYNAHFVVDTGASYVTLSKSLADVMKLDYSRWPTVLSQTANGIKEGRFGFVDEISLQSVSAKHVAVVVTDGLGRIDGLLGLSFLSRFKIELNMEKGYLKLQGKN